MYKKAIRVLIAVVCFTSTTVAVASDTWILLAETDDFRWDGKAGTLTATTNNGKQIVYSALGKITDKKTTRISFERWYVRKVDCQKGTGKLVTTDVNGDFKFDSDFVLDGGSVAATLADMLCGFGNSVQDKGLS